MVNEALLELTNILDSFSFRVSHRLL